MADKKSFVLYTEYEENLEELPDVELGQLFRAIFSYVNRGIVPDLSPSTRMAFSFIRKDLDRNQAKYEETCRRRAEAGIKSGEARRAKAKNAEQAGTKRTNVQFVQQNEQAGTKRTDNDNDNDNENVNDNENDNGNENENVPFRPRKAGTNQFLNILMDDGT